MEHQYKKNVVNIDDLPEHLFVRILSWLPCNLVFQCMCVSKRWFVLLNSSYFVRQFSRFQRELEQNPITGSVLFSWSSLCRYNRCLYPKLPKSITQRFYTKSFLPRRSDGVFYKSLLVSMYNDLALCNNEAGESYYYICNTYTMQWVALPPLKFEWRRDRVGFICDPYREDDKNLEQDGSSSSNAEYRCRVVLIHHKYNALKLNMVMFSSETGEWREFVVPCRPKTHLVFCESYMNLAQPEGVAFKGKLYWSGKAGIMEFDPLAYDSNKNITGSTSNADVFDKCRFINIDHEHPDESDYSRSRRLCVRRGCLCITDVVNGSRVHIWGFKGEIEEGNFCLIYNVSLSPMLDESGLRHLHRASTKLLHLNSFDEDIVYLEVDKCIFICNIRTETVLAKHESDDKKIRAFPFVLPRWPTPLPSIATMRASTTSS